MNLRFCIAACLVLVFTTGSLAADYRVDRISDAPPKDELSADIAAQLDSTGFQVVRGTTRTICEFWLCKQWDVDPGFQPTDEVLYPFQPGQLIGVVRYPRRAGDFRDQDIDSGVYTLRYAQQPVDGAHVGTSPTRDFLLLVNADNDDSSAGLEQETLISQSAEAAQSSHPAMLCLQRDSGDASDEPAIRHNEDHDWWIVAFSGNAKAGDASKKLRVNLVVVGVAAE